MTPEVAPAGSVVVVAIGQAPDAMQVVGQDRPCEQGIGPGCLGDMEGLAQGVDAVDQQRAPASQQVHGEEVGTAGTRTRRQLGMQEASPTARASRYRRMPSFMLGIFRTAPPTQAILRATERGSRLALRKDSVGRVLTRLPSLAEKGSENISTLNRYVL